ncbi:hypothetical protein PybrP1_010393 [[Pythium] brassicae (nom. inval.)]|nr:hypothetical protein PybrP1_010393 [[Pythium] brassicae (nom. inval.)]
MPDRVRSSAAKQEALMRLMSADPSLLGSLDSDLLASLTLASEPPSSPACAADVVDAAASSHAQASASATKHTLIDPRLSFDTAPHRAGGRPTSSKAERATVRLYSDDDVVPSSHSRTPKKLVLLHAESAPADSTAACRASDSSVAGAQRQSDVGRSRSNAVTRESGQCPRKLVSLLDDSGLAEYGACKQQAPAPARVQQSPLPPSVPLSPGRGAAKKKSAKTNKQRCAQAPAARVRLESPAAPPLRSPEQQYEFGGTIVAGSSSGSRGSSFDAADRSTIESTHSSSHDSNDSDDSCNSMASASAHNGGSSRAPPRPKAPPVVLDHRCFVPRQQWVAKSARRSCAVCERDFGVLRQRHSCRMCGEVICSRCSVFRAVNLSVVEGKCRICSCCSVSYRKKLEDIVSFAAAVSDVAEAAATADTRDTRDTDEPRDATTSDTATTPAGVARILLTESTLSLLKADDFERTKAPPSRYDSDLSTLLSSDYSLSRASLSLSLASFSASDLSSSSSSFSSASRSADEELEAALRARQLEKEVEASRSRIEELEVTIAAQESQQEQLSSAQQRELADARRVISALQEKLQQQEASARAAAATRDTLCLSNLRQLESYSSGDDESRALKQKLRVLERQLQQAGISVAEIIPYEVAKAKVADIARRLQEIGSSELVLADKAAQAAARREYYQLEQDMEKYNTALVMTDEYVAEQHRQEAAFEDAHRAANARALRLLRSAIPVAIARLSEAQLRAAATPTGVAFPPELAKRLKRTNVLQLLRTDPADIVRMHPSVVEGYRATGLTLLERRALHAVMQAPCREWKRQQADDMSQKKFQWYSKLRDALESAVRSYAQHCASDSDDAAHSCKLLGLSCPVRAEAKVEALYAAGLGYPDTDEYAAQEVVKSDPDGAGEKALHEAQSYAREVVANQRQRALKAHYKLNMRLVAQAMGALEEVDAIVERLQALDVAVVALPTTGDSDSDSNNDGHATQATTHQQLKRDCDAIVLASRELVLLLAKRAGICVVGKRSADNDAADTRSPLERQSAAAAGSFLTLLLEDVRAFLTETAGSASGSALGSLRYILELLADVEEKNARAAAEAASGTQDDGDEGREDTATGDHAERSAAAAASGVGSTACKRQRWRERVGACGATASSAGTGAGTESVVSSDSNSVETQQASRTAAKAVVLPTSASLFDAIRARKQQQQQQQQTAVPPEAPASKKGGADAAEAAEATPKAPLDLFAAIRARKAHVAASSSVEDEMASQVPAATPSSTTQSA